jgi:hypothetical protein
MVASLRSYGDHRSVHDYEYDHLVSLELGGCDRGDQSDHPVGAIDADPSRSATA